MSFGQQHFGNADLGDPRRTARLVYTANRLVARPDGTLPRKIPNPYDLDAFYRLMNAPAVTHQSVLAPHLARTAELIAHEPVTLLLHDGTVLDYSGIRSIHHQLGPVGNGHGRGFLCHNVLAVTPDRRTLGLAAQRLHVPRAVPAHETAAQRQAHPQRESRLWLDVARALPTTTPGHLVVDIADQGADIYEFLAGLQLLGRTYLVRSKNDRRIEPVAQVTRLRTVARSWESQGQAEVQVQHQKKGQILRTATVCFAAGAVTLRAPTPPNGQARGASLAATCVRVWEPNPPAGVKPLEWFLLTNGPCGTPAAVWTWVEWYSRRMMVEDYHKAMKTGVAVEQMQFTDVSRLTPAVALLSVIALSLLMLRDAGRDVATQSRPAVDYWPATDVEVLCRWRHGGVYREGWTVRELVLALGRLGGHQNRPSDGMPGWQTLWHGWRRLMDMVQGSQIRHGNCGGS